MKEVILDTIVDSLKLIPFLLVAFLIIELLEHKLNNKTKQDIANAVISCFVIQKSPHSP